MKKLINTVLTIILVILICFIFFSPLISEVVVCCMEPNRFQQLKETHPRQYEYCIGGGEYVDGKWQPSKEGLGLGKVLDYINVKY